MPLSGSQTPRSPPWTPELLDDANQALGQLSGDPATYPIKLLDCASARMRRMMAGIEAYRAHPARRALRDPPVIWRHGSARLLDYGDGRGRPCLVVPSLVNRAYILDLQSNRSMLRWMAAQGLRPLLLDWGQPGPDEADFGFSEYFRHVLSPAFDITAAEGPCPILGYCLGGSLASALAARSPDRVSGLGLIGAPWRFSNLAGAAGEMRNTALAFGEGRIEAQLQTLAATFGAIPFDVLQVLFASLDPGLALRKFRHFAKCPPDSAEAEFFVILEDWLNDPVDLAGPAAHDLLVNLALRDVAFAGEWMLDGEIVDPSAIRAPTLAATSAKDRIAPLTSTQPLIDQIANCQVVKQSSGHVGMVVGDRARNDLWRPMAEFLLTAETG